MQGAKKALAEASASLVQEGNAIYLDTGSTCMSIAQALAGRKNTAVVDHTKVGKDAFLRVCDLRVIDGIVTDKDADADFGARARKLGAEVVQV